MKKLSVKIVNIYSNSILVMKLLNIKFRIMFPAKILKLKFKNKLYFFDFKFFNNRTTTIYNNVIFKIISKAILSNIIHKTSS